MRNNKYSERRDLIRFDLQGCKQGPGFGYLKSIKENRGDFCADANASGVFVGHIGDRSSHEPEHRVSGRFAR